MICKFCFILLAKRGRQIVAHTKLVQECVYKDSDYNIRIHFHNAYELLFVKTGQIQINIDGAAYAGGPGSLFVIGRFEEHSLELRTAEYERYYIILDPAQVERLIADRRLLSPLRNRRPDFATSSTFRSTPTGCSFCSAAWHRSIRTPGPIRS